MQHKKLYQKSAIVAKTSTTRNTNISTATNTNNKTATNTRISTTANTKISTAINNRKSDSGYHASGRLDVREDDPFQAKLEINLSARENHLLLIVLNLCGKGHVKWL